MRITGISAYATDLHLAEGSYRWNDQSHASFDTTIVVIDTDEGVQGFGEICPLGAAYMPSYAEGARAGMHMLAPALLGADPRRPNVLAATMDAALSGHPYAKSGIDLAVWDLAAKAAEVPVSTLLGGAFRDRVRLFRVLSRGEPAEMADRLVEAHERGFRQYQMKVGTGVALDLERMHAVVEALGSDEVLAADANTAWSRAQALQIAAAVDDLPLFIEQPCGRYDECLAVRKQLRRPLILDEVMDSRDAIRQGALDGAMDVINLKISRFGGLTGAARARDLCLDLGIAMTIEDTWGGEIATAAIAHLAASVPEPAHFQSSAFHDYHTNAIASGGPVVADGHMRVPAGPGLGVTPLPDALTHRLFEVR